MKKRNIRLLFLFAGVTTLAITLHFLFGLFTPYNFFTAIYDVLTDQPRYVQYGERNFTDKEAISVAPRYGFQYEIAAGCLVSQPLVRGINNYNFFINDYLNKKTGRNWKVKFDTEVDSLFRFNRSDMIRKVVLEQPLVKELSQHLYCMSDGRRKVYVWILQKKREEANVRVCEIRPDKLIRIYYYYDVDPYTLKIKQVHD